MQAMSPLELTALPDGTRIRIVAVIRPHGLDTVMEALLGLGLVDVLVEQVRGYGRQKGHLEFSEEGGFQGGFVPKVRLEFCVDRAHAGEAQGSSTDAGAEQCAPGNFAGTTAGSLRIGTAAECGDGGNG